MPHTVVIQQSIKNINIETNNNAIIAMNDLHLAAVLAVVVAVVPIVDPVGAVSDANVRIDVASHPKRSGEESQSALGQGVVDLHVSANGLAVLGGEAAGGNVDEVISILSIFVEQRGLQGVRRVANVHLLAVVDDCRICGVDVEHIRGFAIDLAGELGEAIRSQRDRSITADDEVNAGHTGQFCLRDLGVDTEHVKRGCGGDRNVALAVHEHVCIGIDAALDVVRIDQVRLKASIHCNQSKNGSREKTKHATSGSSFSL